ncbi:MAG TPA: pyruvate kinase alpha/beta domain-containing protein, partial [Castellaniella sp.]|uniref:pyruvate kinase alpha/beta domain-containing protein n=1 Tax=Castellaniella sp. TaxID=1955812 RepID=UPI002F016420
ELATARRLALVWGVRPVHFPKQLHESSEMIACATRSACDAGVAKPGDTLIVIAGLPFGRSGSTNLLHVALVPPL